MELAECHQAAINIRSCACCGRTRVCSCLRALVPSFCRQWQCCILVWSASCARLLAALVWPRANHDNNRVSCHIATQQLPQRNAANASASATTAYLSASAAEPETIDPLVNGVLLVDHYCRMTIYFTAIAIGILVGFYCARGNCIYFIYTDASKAFDS